MYQDHTEMLQFLINVLERAKGKELYFIFLSDWAFSSKKLKRDIKSTYKLVLETRIQLENFIVLSEQFSEGKDGASWSLQIYLPGTLKIQ